MPKLRKLGVPCPLCGRELTSWDDRASRALGYLAYQVCEDCLCKEYGKTQEPFRLAAALSTTNTEIEGGPDWPSLNFSF